VLLRYSENLVRSRSARRCHRVTRPRRAAHNRRKLTLDLVRETQAVHELRKLTLNQLMQAGHSRRTHTRILRGASSPDGVIRSHRWRPGTRRRRLQRQLTQHAHRQVTGLLSALGRRGLAIRSLGGTAQPGWLQQ
jgi:hypothetical protein